MILPDLNFIRQYYVDIALKHKKPTKNFIGYIPYEYTETHRPALLRKYKFSRFNLDYFRTNKINKCHSSRGDRAIEVKKIGIAEAYSNSGYLCTRYIDKIYTYYKSGKVMSESYIVSEEEIYYIRYDMFGNVINLRYVDVDKSLHVEYSVYLDNIVEVLVRDCSYRDVSTTIYKNNLIVHKSQSINNNIIRIERYNRNRSKQEIYSNRMTDVYILLDYALNKAKVLKNNKEEDISYLIDLSEGLTEDIWTYLCLGYLNV